MYDEEDLEFIKPSRRYRKKKVPIRRDQGELRGAFAIKVLDPRKEQYKRKKIKKEYVDAYEEDG